MHAKHIVYQISTVKSCLYSNFYPLYIIFSNNVALYKIQSESIPHFMTFCKCTEWVFFRVYTLVKNAKRKSFKK